MWRDGPLEAKRQLPRICGIPGFMQEICRKPTTLDEYKKTREWAASALSLSFVLDAKSARACRFLKSIFAPPAISVIYERMGPKTDSCEGAIFRTDDIGRAMRNWRSQSDISVDEVVFAILAGDAAVFSRQLRSQYDYPQPWTNAHAFRVLPVNHLIETHTTNPWKPSSRPVRGHWCQLTQGSSNCRCVRCHFPKQQCSDTIMDPLRNDTRLPATSLRLSAQISAPGCWADSSA
jgi:hypothetical protein